jgi:uncharacterized membrane protein YbhN (UPF0104 family)
MFKAVHIPLNYNHALIVMSINTIGIAFPAGPGMIGNFQYSCMVALDLFNTDKTLAFAFANIYYLIGMGLTVILGLVLLPSLHLSYTEIKKDIYLVLNL